MNNRIFVSSTFEDLMTYRHAVDGALHSLGMKTVDVMALHTSMADIVETSFAGLEKADGFIGIYAARYGDLLEDYERSLTELIYDRVVEMGLPRFIYILDPRESWAMEYLHSDQRGAMMRMFLDRLRKDKDVLRSFTTPEDLAEKVTFDMARFKVADQAQPPLNRLRLIMGILTLLICILAVVLLVMLTFG